MWARRLEDVTVVAVCGQAMCARRAWRTAYTDWPSVTVAFVLNVGSSLCIRVFSNLACMSAGDLQGFKVLLSSLRGTLQNFCIVQFLPSIQNEKAVAASSAIIGRDDASNHFSLAVALLQCNIVIVYVDSIAL